MFKNKEPKPPKPPKRFVIISQEDNFATNNKIIKDTKTGVLYFFHESGYAGGLTPLLGADGKPIIESVESKP